MIAIHVDQSSFDEKVGRKYTAVFAGAKKNDFNPHEPLSDSAKDELQMQIDSLYDMFVGLVVQNRGMKAALVRNTEAGLFCGSGSSPSWMQQVSRRIFACFSPEIMKGTCRGQTASHLAIRNSLRIGPRRPVPTPWR